MPNRNILRVRKSEPTHAAYDATQKLSVEDWCPVGTDNTGRAVPLPVDEDEYVKKYARVGDVIVELIGEVVEEEVFEDVKEDIVVGETYTDGNSRWTCAYKLEDGSFMFVNGPIIRDLNLFWHVKADGEFSYGTQYNKRKLILATKKVSKGKKLVVKRGLV